MDQSVAIEEALADGETLVALVLVAVLLEALGPVPARAGLPVPAHARRLHVYGHRRMAIAAEDVWLERLIPIAGDFSAQEGTGARGSGRLLPTAAAPSSRARGRGQGAGAGPSIWGRGSIFGGVELPRGRGPGRGRGRCARGAEAMSAARKSRAGERGPGRRGAASSCRGPFALLPAAAPRLPRPAAPGVRPAPGKGGAGKARGSARKAGQDPAPSLPVQPPASGRAPLVPRVRGRGRGPGPPRRGARAGSPCSPPSLPAAPFPGCRGRSGIFPKS
uniref:INPP5B PH domain-containing protein n=1 Tax=Nothoprocta perdicaria TaxID=30464 RepID=A0A8C6Z9D7_NOTPE